MSYKCWHNQNKVIIVTKVFVPGTFYSCLNWTDPKELWNNSKSVKFSVKISNRFENLVQIAPQRFHPGMVTISTAFFLVWGFFCLPALLPRPHSLLHLLSAPVWNGAVLLATSLTWTQDRNWPNTLISHSAHSFTAASPFLLNKLNLLWLRNDCQPRETSGKMGAQGKTHLLSALRMPPVSTVKFYTTGDLDVKLQINYYTKIKNCSCSALCSLKYWGMRSDLSSSSVCLSLPKQQTLYVYNENRGRFTTLNYSSYLNNRFLIYPGANKSRFQTRYFIFGWLRTKANSKTRELTENPVFWPIFSL